jgi:hypothetical protein
MQVPGGEAGEAIRTGPQYGAAMSAPETIVCVDCGGVCHRISYEPDEGFEAGDVVAYRCEDCLDRWDIILEDDDVEEP